MCVGLYEILGGVRGILLCVWGYLRFGVWIGLNVGGVIGDLGWGKGVGVCNC